MGDGDAKPNACVACVQKCCSAAARAVGRSLHAIARMCTRQTWRFLVRWYSFLVILGFMAVCLRGIEKTAFISSGCCKHTSVTDGGPQCCEVEDLVPVNVSYTTANGVAWASLCTDAALPTTTLQACMAPGNPGNDAY